MTRFLGWYSPMKMLGLGLVLCTLIVSACAGLNRWRYDTNRVRDSLNRLTPLGSSYDQVWSFASGRYKQAKRNESSGFYRQDSSKPTIVGVKSIEAHIGDYHALPIGTTSVVAYWGFDKDNRLIEIWVWETTDSI